MNHLHRGHQSRNSLPLHVVVGAVALMVLVTPSHAQAVPDPPTPTLPVASGSLYPDAPSVVLLASASAADADNVGQSKLPPCPPPTSQSGPPIATATPPPPCSNQNPLRIVVDAEQRQPLTSRQKGVLAALDVIDPFNLIVISAEAGFGVGLNAHSAYGPGFKGFGRLAGYDLAQDTQGEFVGTFLIPSLVHEDPRYRRMEHASVKRRILHAFERTIIAQHDDGRYMPNYATLLTYPISAELSNLYVPGVQGNAPSTAKRIAIGFATDPAGNLIAEFLPDFARRIHVRSVFIQQIVNQVASGAPLGAP